MARNKAPQRITSAARLQQECFELRQIDPQNVTITTPHRPSLPRPQQAPGNDPDSPPIDTHYPKAPARGLVLGRGTRGPGGLA